MSEKIEWHEGQEVYTSNRGGWYERPYGTAKIAKIYKTGNFVLEGSSQQYRPRLDHASETGRSFGGVWILPINAETTAEKERIEKAHSVRRRVSAIRKKLELRHFWELLEETETDALDRLEQLVSDLSGESDK